ncbi:MAG: thiamine-phosphate kinase [Kiloniellales bacterium]|nr:thiamine-phosphate kinase [Kiloniellales bacterium]
MAGEFDLIETYLAPLAAGQAGAFGLKNDAAIFPSIRDKSVVVTADTMVQGVHFLAEDPPDLVGRKLLRVNLSDIAAMGGKPFGYLVSVALPPDLGETWFAGLARGLGEDQAAFNVGLLGGDTVSTSGPPVLSLTALGRVPEDRVLRRNGARPGDDLYVSGSIGDAALGLLVLQDRLAEVPEDAGRALADRYRLPQPRLELGQALAEGGFARTAIDVSDGLVADLGHLALGAGLAAELWAAEVPVSPSALEVLARAPDHLETVLTGGDDYELLFSARESQRESLVELAQQLDLPITRIGRFSKGEGVSVLGHDGATLALSRGGWDHLQDGSKESA